MTEQSLLDDALLKKLENLELVSRNINILQHENGYRGTRRGGEVEFSDYKSYSPGDDLRYVDWNVYGRLDTFVTKQFTAEEKRRTDILLDVSASMKFGNKFGFASSLAASIGAISLFSGDSVRLTCVGETASGSSGIINSRREIFSLFRFIRSLECGGGTDYRRALSEFSFSDHGPSRIIFISDLWSDELPKEYLNILAGAEKEVSVLQILTREEMNPPYRGRCRFVDAETGREVEIDLSSDEYSSFISAVEQRLENIESSCFSGGMDHVLLLDTIPLEKALFELLREKGIIRHSAG